MVRRTACYEFGAVRFVTADTIVPDPADPQSFNRYAYVKNNPLKYVDPTGHAPFPNGADLYLEQLEKEGITYQVETVTAPEQTPGDKIVLIGHRHNKNSNAHVIASNLLEGRSHVVLGLEILEGGHDERMFDAASKGETRAQRFIDTFWGKGAWEIYTATRREGRKVVLDMAPSPTIRRDEYGNVEIVMDYPKETLRDSHWVKQIAQEINQGRSFLLVIGAGHVAEIQKGLAGRGLDSFVVDLCEPPTPP